MVQSYKKPACGEHLTVGIAFGKLICLDCVTEVVLERGMCASSWYVTSKDEYLKEKSEAVD